ncbi:MAG: hypothetical protein U0326_15880 [Polyangiales bacterium]
MIRTRLCLVISALALAACSDTETATPTDAASKSDACVGASCPDATGDVTPSDGSPTDTSIDAPADAPTDAPSLDAALDVAADSALDVAADVAPPPCPIYQTRCAGACIPTHVDPANCGGCGVRCAAGQVCSGGVCGSTCLTGLSACGGRCVDVQSDNANCGACGTACPTGQGCIAGMCRRLMILDPAGVTCGADGVGPLVDLGGGRCAGGVAETTFRWALCSCQNVSLSARFTTDGFDSTRGPYAPGDTGAGVGANGTFQSSNITEVGGALWIGAAAPWGTASPHTISQVLRVNGSYSGSNTLTARDEAYFNGPVRTSSTVAITGALHLPEGAAIEGDVTYRRAAREAVTVTPPCDCSASARVPVAAFIAEARTRNDNARLGLDAASLTGINTAARIDLPCGRYYLRGITSSAPVTIVAHGHTALFIDGDISMSQPLTITLDPTAELDVVLGGRFGISAALTLGNPAYPALTRLYVGSTDGLSLTNNTVLGANLYLPDGRLGTSGPLEVFGSVFVGDFSSSNEIRVHYDRAVLRVGDACHPTTPTTPADAGTPADTGTPADASRPDGGATPMCASCRDCANQACNGGTCGPCRVDSDCCAPLQCWMGRCVVIPG